MKRKRVLFVCTGNTCRSPMAEHIFRSEIKKRKIKFVDAASAGFFAKGNTSINEKSAACLAARGIDCSKFVPRQLKNKMVETSFLVVCMTPEQKELLGESKNVCCVHDLTGFDVPDPYGGIAALYEQTAKLLEATAEATIRKYFAESGSAVQNKQTKKGDKQ